MTDALVDGISDEAQRLERNKQIVWEHFRALAEGRLEDCLALVDGGGVYWRNILFDGRRPSVSLQVWKDAVKAIIERRLAIPWQCEHVHLINMFAEGDHVILEIHNDSIPFHDGARGEPFDMVYFFNIELRDGKIVSIRESLDGFLMDTMIAEGSWPEIGTDWLDLGTKEKTLAYSLSAGACGGCGMVHLPTIPPAAGVSPDKSALQCNKEIACEHFCAIRDGRLDDALALLDTKGLFWVAARIGAAPRRPYPIESWRRELTQIIKRTFLMPWTDGIHLINAVAEGDKVMLEIHNTSAFHPPLTGNYNMIYNWILTIRDGIITDVREYPDGLYGVKLFDLIFPETGTSVSPLFLLGGLPPYQLAEGSCLSCAKIHRQEIQTA